MEKRVLVLGYGNPGRGDDGLGLALVEALEAAFPQVTWLTAMQLQPEHILELEAHRLVLISDAGWQTKAPFAFAPVAAKQAASFTTHALSPQGLLAIYRDTLGQPPPPVFLLTVRGERFGLGEGISPRAQRHLQAALAFVAQLLANPDERDWQRLVHA